MNENLFRKFIDSGFDCDDCKHGQEPVCSAKSCFDEYLKEKGYEKDD